MTKKRLKEAAQELLARQEANTSLLAYTKYTMPEYEAAEHHKLICDALDKVAEGKIDRLIINMPPRHGKSELASRRFPAYYMSKFPDREIIFATSSADLASKFGGDVLSLVQDPRHKNVFTDFELKSKMPKRDDWMTKDGGTYFASGVGGTITGRGANLIIVDDAIKNMEEAESASARRKLWDWYTSVLSTRKTNTKLPKGQRAAIVVIQTKWHESDLSGKLMQEMRAGGEGWNVLDLPALKTDEGTLPTKEQFGNPDKLKALWPERYDVDALLQERGQDPIRQRHFNCLYQQNPVPDDGTYFDANWVQKYDIIDAPTTGISYYISADYALTEGAGDYTFIVVTAIDLNGDYWVVDGYYGQTDMLTWTEKLLDCAILYRPVSIISESGKIRRASESYIRKRMRERNCYFRLEYITRTNNKEIEARSLQGITAQGKLHLPNTPIGDTILEQMLKFPAGSHDDGVDALANLFLGVDKLYGGQVIEPTKKSRPRKWDSKWDFDEDETNWKIL